MYLKQVLKKNGISRDQFYHWRELGLIPDKSIRTVAIKAGGRELRLSEEAQRRIEIIKFAQQTLGRKRGIKRVAIYFEFEQRLEALFNILRLLTRFTRKAQEAKFFLNKGVISKFLITGDPKQLVGEDRKFVQKYLGSPNVPMELLRKLLKAIGKKPYFLLDPKTSDTKAQAELLKFKDKFRKLKMILRALVIEVCMDELIRLADKAREDPEFKAELFVNLSYFDKVRTQLAPGKSELLSQYRKLYKEIELQEYLMDNLLPKLEDEKSLFERKRLSTNKLL